MPHSYSSVLCHTSYMYMLYSSSPDCILCFCNVQDNYFKYDFKYIFQYSLFELIYKRVILCVITGVMRDLVTNSIVL